MLQLLLGGSGSGKTTLLYQRIRARAEKGEKSILLVPEQFTSSTEGRIYRELGDALSGMVESFSFTSLAEKILSTEGGAAVQTLSDAGRAVLVRRALEELQDNVHYYHRHRRSAAFCQMAAQTIDELNILNATLLGMRQAVEGLAVRPGLALIDGNRCPEMEIPAQSVVKGDARSASISAASILAKVSRDRYMEQLAKEYPQYQLEKHKGYPTKLHYALLDEYGIQPFYRRSFLKKRGYV